MGIKKIVDTTDNSCVYKRALKILRGLRGDINCSICPYHRVENRNYYNRRNWKWYRETQYKTVKSNEM